jgi:hypothetical protein
VADIDIVLLWSEDEDDQKLYLVNNIERILLRNMNGGILVASSLVEMFYRIVLKIINRKPFD